MYTSNTNVETRKINVKEVLTKTLRDLQEFSTLELALGDYCPPMNLSTVCLTLEGTEALFPIQKYSKENIESYWWPLRSKAFQFLTCSR